MIYYTSKVVGQVTRCSKPPGKRDIRKRMKPRNTHTHIHVNCIVDNNSTGTLLTKVRQFQIMLAIDDFDIFYVRRLFFDLLGKNAIESLCSDTGVISSQVMNKIQCFVHSH